MNIASDRMIFHFFILRVRKYNPYDAVVVGRHVDNLVPDRPGVICESLYR